MMRFFSRWRKAGRSIESPEEREIEELKEAVHEANHPFSIRVENEDVSPQSEQIRHQVREHRRAHEER